MLTLGHLRDWYEFFRNAILSVSISYFGIFLGSLLYNPVYSSLKYLDLINSLAKKVPKRTFWDKIINKVYNWSYNCGYIDVFYETSLTKGIRRFVIDGITNGVGVMSFFVGECQICRGWTHLLLPFFCIYLVYQSYY